MADENEGQDKADDDEAYASPDDHQPHVAKLLDENPGPLGEPEPSDLDETTLDEESPDG